MKELISAFKKFIMRDLSFIIGGSLVILSFLSIYGRICYLEDYPIALYILVAGIAYTIGYAIQDGFTVLGIIRTKAALSPNLFGKKLYRWFERRQGEKDDVEYKKIITKDYVKAKIWLYDEANERFQADHERTESLKQVGTAIGPCFVVAALILLAEPLLKKVAFRWALIFAMLIHGMVLVALGWLKVTQQAQYLIKRWKLYESNHGEGEKKKQ